MESQVLRCQCWPLLSYAPVEDGTDDENDTKDDVGDHEHLSVSNHIKAHKRTSYAHRRT